MLDMSTALYKVWHTLYSIVRFFIILLFCLKICFDSKVKDCVSNKLTCSCVTYVGKESKKGFFPEKRVNLLIFHLILLGLTYEYIADQVGKKREPERDLEEWVMKYCVWEK